MTARRTRATSLPLLDDQGNITDSRLNDLVEDGRSNLYWALEDCKAYYRSRSAYLLPYRNLTRLAVRYMVDRGYRIHDIRFVASEYRRVLRQALAELEQHEADVRARLAKRGCDACTFPADDQQPLCDQSDGCELLQN